MGESNNGERLTHDEHIEKIRNSKNFSSLIDELGRAYGDAYHDAYDWGRSRSHEEHVVAIESSKDFSDLRDNIDRAYGDAQRRAYDRDQPQLQDEKDTYNFYDTEDSGELAANVEAEYLEELMQESYRHNGEKVIIRDEALPGREVDPQLTYRLDFVGPFEELSMAARKVESRVFEETFGNSSDTMREMYKEYEKNSRFLVVTAVNDDGEREVVGVMRVIEGNEPSDYLTLEDLANLNDDPSFVDQEALSTRHADFDPQKTWDIGTLAVIPEWRRTFTSFFLYSGLYREAKEHDIEHWLTILDEHAYGILMRMGAPFEPLLDQEPIPYAGSGISHPSYAAVEDVRAGFASKGRGYDKMICDGVNLGGKCDFPEEIRP